MDANQKTTTGSKVARILIADDHPLIRAALRSILSAAPDLEVAGEAGNGREAIDFCHDQQPDLVLMDVSMPLLDGVTATREIKQEWPSIPVIVVSAELGTDLLLGALIAGAAAYVLKETPRHELLATIHEVLSGRCLLKGPAGELVRDGIIGHEAPASSSPRTAFLPPPAVPVQVSL